jgi:alpha-glucosidase
MNASRFLFILLLCVVNVSFAQLSSNKTLEVSSPNNKLRISILIDKEITYTLIYDNEIIIEDSPISLLLQDGQDLGKNPKYRADFLFGHDRYLRPIYGFQNNIHEHANELMISFKGDYSLVFRAFDNGMAYRWVTKFSGGMMVQNEHASFNFKNPYSAYHQPIALEESFGTNYVYKPLGDYKGMVSLPLVVELPRGRRGVVMEADLLDYPSMNLVADTLKKGMLKGVFAKHPKNWLRGGEKEYNLKVNERHNFIAQTNGSRSLPWRIVSIAENDKDLLNNHLVYILSSDSKLGDIDWIKPGKAAWDKWNDLNLFNVPFKTGVNNETYEYYIDFAAENKLDYIILDEGWSDPMNLMMTHKNLNIEQLATYARSKNVKLILWCVWHTLDRQLEEAFEQFAKWGVAGVKIDHINRDDQIAVNFYERVAKSAAGHKMMVYFHGAFKPTGLERTYPNCLTREAVKGLEANKLDEKGVSPSHDVVLPFTRMVAGAMDYTPGAMNNMSQKSWRMIAEKPMSQGTRCHQLAMYVVYYSPLQTLSDSPTTYQDETECMHFLANIPTVWSETVPLDSKIGEYVTVARKSSEKWYIGAMTNWTAREYTVKLDFLDEGTYELESYLDGPNAERDGRDYQRKVTKVTKNDNLTISMASGGGFGACLKRVY